MRTEGQQVGQVADAGEDHAACAIAKEGIPVYGKNGVKALEDWLSNQGVKNIQAVNDAIKGAKPWYEKLGVPLVVIPGMTDFAAGQSYLAFLGKVVAKLDAVP